MSILTFDLETVPDIAGLRRLETVPSTLSDAELLERVLDARAEKTGQRFLPLHLQRIVAIGCCLRRTLRDGSPDLYVACLGTEADNEAMLIQKFFNVITKYSPQLVSWNGGGFDLPVLHYRGMIHGITAQRYWEWGDGSEVDSRDFKWNNYLNRYHTRHLDLMDVLAAYQPKAYAPLDELARLSGFPGKMGMDGSQVWPAFQRGELSAIRQYCQTDVVNTYLLYNRFRLMRGEVSREVHDEEVDFVRATLEGLDGPQWPTYLSGFAEN